MIRNVERPAAAAPTPDAAGGLDLGIYTSIARLYGGRTTAAAVQALPAGDVTSDHPGAGPALLAAFTAALAAAHLELDPDAGRRPRLTYGVSYSTRRLRSRPVRHVTLLVTAHVRIADAAR